jgi:eukaryotic-like serine/threonine-protein kinase
MNDGDVIQHLTTTILGRYRLIKQIGSGGMGDVWLGEDPRLHRHVAIKTLPVQKQQNDEFVLRFEREARAAAALNHPHILPVHDFGKQSLSDGRVIAYIVMPYITGGTLADRIATNNSRQILMPQHEAITYLSQAAQAIDYAHRRGIIHRDIKPGNMLLRHDNWLLLGDFGIARMLSSTENLTRTGAAGTGTPEFMAPEQAQGRAEASSDIYSLAVLAYYLLTGQLPFTAETAFATSILHMTSSPPSPRKINPTLSLSQEIALLHGLAKNPGERPASASALIAELQQETSATPHNTTGYRSFNRPASELPSVANSQLPVTGQSQVHQYPSVINNQLPATGQSQLRGQPLTANNQLPVTDQSQRPVTQNSSASFLARMERKTQVPEEQLSTPSPVTKKLVSRRNMFIGGGAVLVVLGTGVGVGSRAGAWTMLSNMYRSGSTRTTTAIPFPTPDPNGPDLILQGHTKPVTSLAWSSQSTTMLASAAEDGTVRLWQIKQLQQLAVKLSATAKQSFHPSGPLQLSWSSDGGLLAIGNTGRRKVGSSASIDIYTGDLQETAPGYSAPIIISDTPPIEGLGWLNHNLIAVATQPTQTGEKQLQLNLWNTQRPQQQFAPVSIAGSLSTESSNRAPVLLVSPDGSSLALAETEGAVIGQAKSSGTAIQWQQRLGPVKPDGQIKALTWLPDGTAICALVTKNNKDFSLAFWDVQKETGQTPLATNAVLTTISWCPASTSSLVATGSQDGRVLIWNYGGSNVPASLNSNLNAEVITLSWSADGQWLAAGFNDKNASILVWNIQGRGI